MNASTCSICGTPNSENLLLCGACGADLTSDLQRRAEAKAEAGAPDVELAAEEMGGPCCPACGAANQAWAVLCAGCGADLPCEGGVAKTVVGGLWLIVQGRRYRCAPGDVLGREGTVGAEEFISVGTVHRRHVQLLCGAGGWRVAVLEAARNSTFLDGELLRRGEEYRLVGEHRLRLSTAIEVELCVSGAPPWGAGEKGTGSCRESQV